VAESANSKKLAEAKSAMSEMQTDFKSRISVLEAAAEELEVTWPSFPSLVLSQDPSPSLTHTVHAHPKSAYDLNDRFEQARKEKACRSACSD